jgi:two-component system nitrogen regulation sensor histidine kinase GlnL
LEALPQAIVAIDGALAIRYVNAKAEEFFYASASTLLNSELSELIPSDSPVFSLIRQVLRTAAPVADHGLMLQGRRCVPGAFNRGPTGSAVESARRGAIGARDGGHARP